MFFNGGGDSFRKTTKGIVFEDFVARVRREASIRMRRDSHNGASDESFVSN